MRRQKAEYLEYQRQVALQRMAEQEREVAAKVSHQTSHHDHHLFRQVKFNSSILKAAGYGQPAAPGPGMYMPPGAVYMPQHFPGMMQPGNATHAAILVSS